MISKICGVEYSDLYSVAYTCGAMVTILLTSMNSDFSPWLGEQLHDKNYSAVRNMARPYVSGFCYLAIGIMLLAPEILLIMGGQSYLEAKYVMPAVAMGCVCQFVYTIFVNVEQYEKKTIGMAFASVAAAMLNFVLNLIFIPKFGYIVAAYTTMVGFLFLLVAHIFLVRKYGYRVVYDYKMIICEVLLMIGITLAKSYLEIVDAKSIKTIIEQFINTFDGIICFTNDIGEFKDIIENWKNK